MSQITRAVSLDVAPKIYSYNYLRIAVYFDEKTFTVLFRCRTLAIKCYVAKLILCISLVHVIGKPLYTINDCASYFVFVFPLAFLSPFLLVTRFCLENFVTIVRKTSLHIQMVKIVSYFLFIVSLCLVVCLFGCLGC